MIKLNQDCLLNIKDFIYYSKLDMDYWKAKHFFNYRKVMYDIRDTIREIKIERNGKKKVVFSLFSLSILYDSF